MYNTEKLTDIAIDTLEGFSATPKYHFSKYFYDDRGSKIFQKIMNMSEYYLTNCEEEIFRSQKEDIFHSFVPNNERFDVIELGAGDGMKTKVLLEYFKSENADFTFMPIDISEEAIKILVNDLANNFPQISVDAKVGDYFQMMEEINSYDSAPKIILFLGSNIGNYNESESIAFFSHLHKVMNRGDKLFIGFDLKKDPRIILDAYDDPHGHTAAFNLNLLQRLNDELGANFNLEQFKHQEVYDPQTGTAKSFLVSLKNQIVSIEGLSKSFEFNQWETIYTEMSQKYDLNMIASFADRCGFEIVRNFTDSRQYFMNSLWKLKEK